MKLFRVLALVLAVTTLIYLLRDYYGSANTRRVNDYLAYYSSFELLKSGFNPYNTYLTNLKQVQLGRPASDMILQMWYAPWAYLFLRPSLGYSLATSATIWFLMNIGFLVAGTFLVWRTYHASRVLPAAVLIIGALHFPNCEVLYAGQLGLLMFFSTALFLYLVESKQDLFVGLGLIALTIKPHLFLPCALYGLFWLHQTKRYKVVMSSALAISCTLLLTEILYPGLIRLWLANQNQPLADFRTPTLSGFLRGIIFDVSGNAPLWPLVLCPLLGCLVTLILTCKKRSVLSWKRDLPWLLVVGIFFAPYAWIHDQALLVHAQLGMYCASFDNPQTNKLVIRKILVLQLILFSAALILPYTAQYFWMPLAVALLFNNKFQGH